jgi:hypothetical protein
MDRPWLFFDILTTSGLLAGFFEEVSKLLKVNGPPRLWGPAAGPWVHGIRFAMSTENGVNDAF